MAAAVAAAATVMNGSKFVVDSLEDICEHAHLQAKDIITPLLIRLGTQEEKKIISYLYSLYLSKSFKDHLVVVLWLLAGFLG